VHTVISVLKQRNNRCLVEDCIVDHLTTNKITMKQQGYFSVVLTTVFARPKAGHFKAKTKGLTSLAVAVTSKQLILLMSAYYRNVSGRVNHQKSFTDLCMKFLKIVFVENLISDY